MTKKKDESFFSDFPDGVRGKNRGKNRMQEVDVESWAAFSLAAVKIQIVFIALCWIFRTDWYTSGYFLAHLVGFFFAFKGLAQYAKFGKLTKNFPTVFLINSLRSVNQYSILFFTIITGLIFLPFGKVFPFTGAWLWWTFYIALSWVYVESAFKTIKYNMLYMQKQHGEDDLPYVRTRMSEIAWVSKNPDHVLSVMAKKFLVPVTLFLTYVWSLGFIPLLAFSILALGSGGSSATRSPYVLLLSGGFSKSFSLLVKLKYVCGSLPVGHMLQPKTEMDTKMLGRGLTVDWFRNIEPDQAMPDIEHLGWESAVADLMHFSKVIIFDCRSISDAFVKELKLYVLEKPEAPALFIGSKEDVLSAFSLAEVDIEPAACDEDAAIDFVDNYIQSTGSEIFPALSNRSRKLIKSLWGGKFNLRNTTEN